MTALAAVSQGLNIAKGLRELDKGLADAEWKGKLAEIQSALADAKIALAEAQEEIAGKDREVARLAKTLKRKNEDLIEHHGFRYEKSVDGEPTGGPFCPVCIEVEGHLIRLADVNLGRGSTYACPHCKGDFGRRISWFR